MGILIYGVIFFLIMPALVALGVFFVLLTQKKVHQSTGGVVNYDSFMRIFIYRVDMPEEMIINRLKAPNVLDELSCEIDVDKSVIRFSEYGSSREYFFEIKACEGYSILKLSQAKLIGARSHIPFKLNTFIISKLNAQPIPYM